MTKRLLVIDALNWFIRAYIVDPSLSSNGQPIGGIKGSLKILQKLVRETKPDQILIAWDGPDGSRKRKDMDKNYKEGRKPIRLNRAFHNLTDNEEIQNKIWQQMRLVEYLNNMPIMQVMIPQIEADDIISYVVQMPYYKGWQKVIVSNDKDFLQLCNDETVVYRPAKKMVYNKNAILEEIGIHPTNMALARAIIGDASDNLPGIKGVGFKTVKKRFPFLAEEVSHTLDNVFEFCEQAEDKGKVFTNILEGRELIAHNYKMMQLYSPQMSVQSKMHTKAAIETFEHHFNKTEILKMMRADGFGELNWEDLRTALNKIAIQE